MTMRIRHNNEQLCWLMQSMRLLVARLMCALRSESGRCQSSLNFASAHIRLISEINLKNTSFITIILDFVFKFRNDIESNRFHSANYVRQLDCPDSPESDDQLHIKSSN